MLVASSAKITYGVTVHPSTATRNEKNRMNSKPAPSEIQLDLPDLKKPSGIQPANVFALQPIYVASQLEKLKIFSVVDRLVELALNGTLPVSNSGAGRLLSDYWEKSGTMSTPARLVLKTAGLHLLPPTENLTICGSASFPPYRHSSNSSLAANRPQLHSAK
jgi:hypothetical protein